MSEKQELLRVEMSEKQELLLAIARVAQGMGTVEDARLFAVALGMELDVDLEGDDE